MAHFVGHGDDAQQRPLRMRCIVWPATERLGLENAISARGTIVKISTGKSSKGAGIVDMEVNFSFSLDSGRAVAGCGRGEERREGEAS